MESCEFPNYAPSTSYRRGCRCDRCREAKSVSAEAWRQSNPGYLKRWGRTLGGMVLRRVERARHRAEKSGLPFDVGIGAVMESSWTGACLCCGARLKVKQTGRQGPGAYSPTWDRIAPALGYVAGNVAWLCRNCNSLKSDMTPEQITAKAEREHLYIPLANYVSKYSKT